jgi:tetraacyldisaccharide 4'-kinase
MLAPLARLYGLVAARRLAQDGQRSPLPCICVGNFVAGGAGKTPTALAVAARLRTLGHRPVFLTRGYRGRLAGPVLVDPARHGFRDVGDEALLLAAEAPTIVARDRPAGARLALAHGDVLVMDDGFQNPSLRKDLSIVVVDAAQGIGNGLVMPAGPLRAPLAAQLRRTDAVLEIGEDADASLGNRFDKPVLRGTLQPDATMAGLLRGRRVLAFCGIGRPEKLAATLRETGADLVELCRFADHHAFTAAEADALLSRAAALDALPVCTAKDSVRLGGEPALQRLAKASRVLPVTLMLEEPEKLDALLSAALAAARNRAP